MDLRLLPPRPHIGMSGYCCRSSSGRKRNLQIASRRLCAEEPELTCTPYIIGQKASARGKRHAIFYRWGWPEIHQTRNFMVRGNALGEECT